ncbi:hypothetical protein DXG01_003393 [Tephrocybe rancida]|nr:hypothetical protein DXG01_003393 [Tephrocybe rancida]
MPSGSKLSKPAAKSAKSSPTKPSTASASSPAASVQTLDEKLVNFLQSAIGSPTPKKKHLGNTPAEHRVRKKTEKALAAEQEVAAKPRSRITCVFPGCNNPLGESHSASPSPVKKEPVEKISGASVILLSSDNESLPEFSIMPPSKPPITPPSCKQRTSKYVDEEATDDYPVDEDGTDEDSEEEKLINSLDDFIVCDSDGEDASTPMKGVVASDAGSSNIGTQIPALGAGGPKGKKNSKPTITSTMLLCADPDALAEALLPYSNMVMQPPIQDLQLVPSYEGLPHLFHPLPNYSY